MRWLVDLISEPSEFLSQNPATFCITTGNARNKDIQIYMHKPLSLFILLYFFSSFQFLVFLSKYCTVDIQVLLAYLLVLKI